MPSVEKVVSIMKKGTEEIAGSSDNTCKRRAQTVRAWIDWTIKLTNR